jgi:hypothetical protein
VKIYIAGPMRGIPEFNFPAFDDAAKRGRALGHTIISPAELDRDHGFNEKGQDGKVNEKGHSGTVTAAFMRGAAWRDFLAIVGPDMYTPGVDALAMLPGWEKSRGAKGERALAEWIGLEVLDAQTFKPFAEPTFCGHPITPAIVNGDPDEEEDDFSDEPFTQAAAAISNGEYVVKDSGSRTTFATGAVRDSGESKGWFHCLPFVAIERLAKLYEAGGKKYGKSNWKKGIPLSRYLDSCFRHLHKLAEGWTDEDHAAAVMWNAAGFIWTLDAVKSGKLPADLDDIGFATKAA